MPLPSRGQIWEFDLNPTRGREQRGVRPCLVVSIDALNRSRFGAVLVCPVTTRERASFAWRPGLLPTDLRVVDATWEARPSWVATDQLVTVDTEARAVRHLATITAGEKMSSVDDSLRMILGL